MGNPVRVEVAILPKSLHFFSRKASIIIFKCLAKYDTRLKNMSVEMICCILLSNEMGLSARIGNKYLNYWV